VQRLLEAPNAHGTRAPIAFATALCAAVLLAATGLAHAKPARCFTTDDGEFACDFHVVDRDGSFTISSPGKPTFTLNMSEPGVAYGFMQIGSKSTPLPGRYIRDPNDGACWINDVTKTKICAR